jgi:hypothetical protein
MGQTARRSQRSIAADIAWRTTTKQAGWVLQLMAATVSDTNTDRARCRAPHVATARQITTPLTERSARFDAHAPGIPDGTNVAGLASIHNQE